MDGELALVNWRPSDDVDSLPAGTSPGLLIPFQLSLHTHNYQELQARSPNSNVDPTFACELKRGIGLYGQSRGGTRKDISSTFAMIACPLESRFNVVESHRQAVLWQVDDLSLSGLDKGGLAPLSSPYYSWLLVGETGNLHGTLLFTLFQVIKRPKKSLELKNQVDKMRTRTATIKLAALLATAGAVQGHVMVKIDQGIGLRIWNETIVIGEDATMSLEQGAANYQFNIFQKKGKQDLVTFTVGSEDAHGEFAECRVWGYGFARLHYDLDKNDPGNKNYAAQRENGEVSSGGDIIPFTFKPYIGDGWGGKKRQMIELNHCGCTKTGHRLECRRKKRSGEYIGGDSWPGQPVKCGPGDQGQKNGEESKEPHCETSYWDGDKVYAADGDKLEFTLGKP